MVRKMLTNRQWARIWPLLPGKATDRGRAGSDNRITIEGILWIVRMGSPWRDLPTEFGKWGTVYQRFNRWAEKGVFDRIFEATSGDLDLQTVQVDGSFAMVHHLRLSRRLMCFSVPRFLATFCQASLR